MIKSLCFLTTYQCNARCDYCECGPTRSERLTLAEMERLIDEAAALGTIALVVFSGGEPTLLRDDLFAAIRHASSKGLLTRIVTNGWWGRTPQLAAAMVDRLLDAGLSEINISIDDLHQEWIPLEHARNAFLACYARQLKCLIAYKRTRSSKITKQTLSDSFGVELIDLNPRRPHTLDEECRLISTSTVIPVGRGDHDIDREDLIYGKWNQSCGSVLNDLVVGPDGRLLPCCGIVRKGIPELTGPDLHGATLIQAIDEANRDLVLNWIALEGPGAIMRFVREKDPSVVFDDRFVGICHACNEVLTRPDARAVIEQHIDEVVERVSVHRAFLERVRGEEPLVSMYTRG